MPHNENDQYKHLARRLLAASDFGVEHNLKPDELARRAAQLIDENAALRHLAERSGDPLAMRHGLTRLALPPRLAFMLAVARDHRPQLLQHLLVATLIAHYLALRQEFSEAKTAELLIAALCHDLGELHTDPALLEPEHRVEAEELRYIYVHPITGHMIAQEIDGVSAAAASAVLQHQERLDGSGYPYGLHAEQIGAYARIIAIADVCAAILARFGSHERLSTLMRLNRQKFEPRLLDLLEEGFRTHAEAPDRSDATALARLAIVSDLLERWNAFRRTVTDDGRTPPPAPLAFLFERMVVLRSMLLQFGFDPESQQLLTVLAAEDPRVAVELAAALDEVHWQFADLEREIVRRRDTLTPALSDAHRTALDAWSADVDSYLGVTAG